MTIITIPYYITGIHTRIHWQGMQYCYCGQVTCPNQAKSAQSVLSALIIACGDQSFNDHYLRALLTPELIASCNQEMLTKDHVMDICCLSVQSTCDKG